MSNRANVFTKDPDSVLDFTVYWGDWLPEGDTLADSEWVVDGLVVETSSFTNTETTVWLSGGTVNVRETVTNRVTTADGRIEDFSFTINVREK